MHLVEARIHALENAVAQRSTTLDDPPTHGAYMGKLVSCAISRVVIDVPILT